MVEALKTTQPDLGRQFAAGEDDVVEMVYAAHGALVYSYRRRMLGPGRAADATGDVFIAAWRSSERYRPDAGTLIGWLMGIARFKVIDILRVDGRQPIPSADEPFHRHPQPLLEDATRIAERMLVARAMADLPTRTQEAIRLGCSGDLTHIQNVERGDLPLGTVKYDIRRTLEQMKCLLEGFDHAHSPRRP